MAVEIKILPPATETDDNTITKIKTTGNIICTTNFKHLKRSCDIIKIDKYHYVLKREMIDFKTGELLLKDFNCTENRAQNYSSLFKSFVKLRDYINTNLTDVSKAHWCTLTYADNMQDLNRLQYDFKNFWDRFKLYCNLHNFPIPEYIYAVEPQERGAWHIHLIIIWDINAPYIPHDDFWKLWSPKGFKKNQDFVKIQSLYKDGKAIDNVGAYLTSYLTDTVSDDEHKKRKYDRLQYYPSGMNIYRKSNGIKKPTIEYMGEDFARKKVSSAKLTYEKRIALEDKDKGYSNEILYRNYNLKPRESQVENQ